MKQILTGEKSYFLQSEIGTLTIPRLQYLNMELIVQKVYNIAAVRKYLPDYTDNPSKRLCRDFMFAIVHKLDPDFFKQAVAEIETHIVEKKPAILPKTLSIKPELLAILKRA
jgi:hypothetical protein